MLKEVSNYIDSWANRFASINPYTPVIGLSRSLIACGTLATLLFNQWSLIFPYGNTIQFRPSTVFDTFNYFFLFGPSNTSLSVTIAIAILFLVIAGILPRLTGVLHFWVTYSFYKYCPIIEGGDQISSILTLFFMLILWFDNRISHWSKSNPLPRPFINVFANGILLFVQVQVSIVYFHAFVGKLAVTEWVNGTDTYYWFTHNIFGFPSWLRPAGELLLRNKFIITSITWGTILLEILLFAALFMSYNRRRFLFKAAITFHFGILIVHGLVSFFFAMAGALVIYLISPNQTVFHSTFQNIYYAFLRKPILTK